MNYYFYLITVSNYPFCIVSFRIIMTDKKESRKRNRASLEPLKVTIQNDTAERDYVRVIQVEPVSNDTLLSVFVHHFIYDYSSIIGVHRVADYVARITDNVVFIYLTSAKEYRQLLAVRHMMVEGRHVNITDPDLLIGCARYVIPFAVGTEADIQKSPMPMSLFGFRTLPTVTTFYVIAVLQELEQQYTTTGFKLAYCERMKTTRNFGFATFISREMALELNGKQFYVMTDRIEAKLPNATPVLIHKSKSYLLHNGRCDLSDAIREANWLHANILDPTKPMHPTTQEPVAGPSGIANSVNRSAGRPLEASGSNLPINRNGRLPSVIVRVPMQHESNSNTTNRDMNSRVVRYNTPPASPELSLGEDYDLDEEGELHTAKKQRK